MPAGSIKDPEVAQLFSVEDPENRFLDLKEIGHGSFGAVYFAVDSASREVVAIKKMAYSGKQHMEKWTDIVKEVRFLQQLSHRHIVEYKGCYLKEHTCWLVMEYCVGSAADIIEVQKKPLLEVEIAAMCSETLQGLIYLHNLDRIHRDVKAGNILLTDHGIVKLGDFGSASFQSPAQSFVGTPYWMAPEVILAMDEGTYDCRVDIWSLGITCVELGERKPPLFNMNAMSALYHIAQNDAPSLSNGPTDNWSPNFRNFVDSCLSKDPTQRPTAQECTFHPFVSHTRSSTQVLLDLVLRCKDLVHNIDNRQYRKMWKMFLGDDLSGSSTAASSTTSPGLVGETSSLDSEDVDSVDDDLGSGSSTTNSLASLDTPGSGSGMPPMTPDSAPPPLPPRHYRESAPPGVYSLDSPAPPIPPPHMYPPLQPHHQPSPLVSHSDANVIVTSGSASGIPGSSPHGTTTTSSPAATGVDSSGGGPDSTASSFISNVQGNEVPPPLPATPPPHSFRAGGGPPGANLSMGELESAEPSSSPDLTASMVVQQPPGVPPRSSSSRASSMSMVHSSIGGAAASLHRYSANMNSLPGRRQQFETIRPVKAVLQEAAEHEAVGMQQMTDYKRLRRNHQKELKQLDEKQSLEKETLKTRLDREYQQKLKSFTRELEKLHVNHQSQLDSKAKSHDDIERRQLKQMKEQQMSEMRHFTQRQRKDYKSQRDSWKQEAKQTRLGSDYANKKCDELSKRQAHELAERTDEQQQGLDLYIRKIRRTHIVNYHKLEQDLLKEELGVRHDQLGEAHKLLRRHAEETQRIEADHSQELQALRDKHLKRRHLTERQNQEDYTKRLQDDLRKRHTVATKQQPKELKIKESAIRKQYREAVKTQTRQYKALKSQITEGRNKSEQASMLKQIKYDQKRKIATLEAQYEKSISEMMDSQTEKLETGQDTESVALREQLEKELDLLLAAQSRAGMRQANQHDDERKSHQERLSLRRAVLEQKIEEELVKFDDERHKRIGELMQRQSDELLLFDEASNKLGIHHSLSLSVTPSSTASTPSSTHHPDHLQHSSSVQQYPQHRGSMFASTTSSASSSPSFITSKPRAMTTDAIPGASADITSSSGDGHSQHQSGGGVSFYCNVPPRQGTGHPHYEQRQSQNFGVNAPISVTTVNDGDYSNASQNCSDCGSYSPSCSPNAQCGGRNYFVSEHGSPNGQQQTVASAVPHHNLKQRTMSYNHSHTRENVGSASTTNASTGDKTYRNTRSNSLTPDPEADRYHAGFASPSSQSYHHHHHHHHQQSPVHGDVTNGSNGSRSAIVKNTSSSSHSPVLDNNTRTSRTNSSSSSKNAGTSGGTVLRIGIDLQQ